MSVAFLIIFLFSVNSGLANPPETWNLTFASNLSYSKGTATGKTNASGSAKLVINEKGILTGNGKMKVSETLSTPGQTTTASGTGAFTVVGKRDGENLIFRFQGDEITLKGSTNVAGISIPYEDSFDPAIIAPTDSVIQRAEGATTKADHSLQEFSGKTVFTLSGGINVVKESPLPQRAFHKTKELLTLELDSMWSMVTPRGTITTTLVGKAEFPLPKQDGPAKGKGPLTMKNQTLTAKGELILDGWIKDRVLTFLPRATFQSGKAQTSGGIASSDFSSGIWAFNQDEKVSIRVKDGAEVVRDLTHAPSRSSGRIIWKLRIPPKLVGLTKVKVKLLDITDAGGNSIKDGSTLYDPKKFTVIGNKKTLFQFRMENQPAGITITATPHESNTVAKKYYEKSRHVIRLISSVEPGEHTIPWDGRGTIDGNRYILQGKYSVLISAKCRLSEDMASDQTTINVKKPYAFAYAPMGWGGYPDIIVRKRLARLSDGTGFETTALRFEE